MIIRPFPLRPYPCRRAARREKRGHGQAQQRGVAEREARLAVACHIPVRGVVADVGADVRKGGGVADNDVVEVAVPRRDAAQVTRDADLEAAHNRAERAGGAMG